MDRRRVQRKDKSSIKVESSMSIRRRSLKIVIILLIVIIRKNLITRMTLIRVTAIRKKNILKMARKKSTILYTLFTKIKMVNCIRRRSGRTPEVGSLRERLLMMEAIRRLLLRMPLLPRKRIHLVSKMMNMKTKLLE